MGALVPVKKGGRLYHLFSLNTRYGRSTLEFSLIRNRAWLQLVRTQAWENEILSFEYDNRFWWG